MLTGVLSPPRPFCLQMERMEMRKELRNNKRVVFIQLPFPNPLQQK